VSTITIPTAAVQAVVDACARTASGRRLTVVVRPGGLDISGMQCFHPHYHTFSIRELLSPLAEFDEETLSVVGFCW
jgi:hypothetical protein